MVKPSGKLEKFVFLTDLHWGYERKNGHRRPLHDKHALSVVMQFIYDYKPDHIILGGDILDCGSISHHNHGKPGAVEGFRLVNDAKELREAMIAPLQALKPKTLTYIVGNHEDWLTDLEETIPALEGILDIRSVLSLGPEWKVVPQGEYHKLGKLIFVHGDQIRGGEHHAKWGAFAYEGNVRFGHYHTYQTYTKLSAVEANGHTAIAVPCLCHKLPKYGGGAPNKWIQGFLFGAVNGPECVFGDAVAIIVDGRSVINGKVYETQE